MPRYRFHWENVDAAVRLRLCGDDVDEQDSVDVLRRRYGARPKERFVAACWPALRDAWLARDDVARAEVVASLRAAGLGDGAMALDGREREQAFLRTCRNQKTLRHVVLAGFIRSGEAPVVATKAGPAGPTWAEFERALARALAGFAPGQCLVLSVRGTGVEGMPGPAGSSSYVQFIATDRGLRAEAVSNSFLSDSERLSPDAQVRLVELGWQPPTHLPGEDESDPTGSSNYFHDHDRGASVDDVAATAVTTLQDVYAAGEPTRLSYLSFDRAGNEVEVPDLGVEPQHLPSNVVEGDAEGLLPSPATAEELRAQVEQALLPVLTGDRVVYDDDGDIPIRFGTTQVFVRSSVDAPVVRVFAILLTDLLPSAALIDAVNDLNQRFLFGKFFWDGSSVVMAMDVPSRPFVAAHLLHAVGTVGQVGDDLDEELQESFGGRTFYGVRVPPADEGPTGGYL
jgi:hypothetical protein